MRPPGHNTPRRADLVAAPPPPPGPPVCAPSPAPARIVLDPRVAAEIIFDQGLGDLFVIRTAGHIIDTAVLGSIEYAVHLLNTPLIVVLGHDSCGGVAAAVEALKTGEVPPGFLRDVVEKVSP